MNPPDETTQQTRLWTEIAEVLSQVHLSARRDRLDEQFAANIFDMIAADARQAEDYGPVKAAIQRRIRDMERLRAMLQDMLAQVEALAEGRVRQEQYGERWWEQKREALYAAFQRHPETGWHEWLQTYAEALIAWELGICDRLANEAFPFPPQAMAIVSCFQRGTQAIKDESYRNALDMLKFLTHQSPPVLDGVRQAILLVFAGRIHLYKASENEAALEHFEQAQRLAPGDGRPYASLGNYYQALHEHDRAMRLYQQAIERSPDHPDGYIGLGLLAEDDRWWDEAKGWYGQAIKTVRIEKDAHAALRKLLSPVSGNLYLQLAQVLKGDDAEAALGAVVYALHIGIRGEGDYPDHRGYRLKGEILETLQRSTEAAEAYYEAGRRLSWRNEHQVAADLLAHANQLNPKHLPTYWSWSESLRLRSYLSELPYVDDDIVQESQRKWDEGAQIGWPEENYSWAYITRALISEQLANLPDKSAWALWWEAIVYLERAVLLRDWDAYHWAYLGRFHRNLGTESSALYATQKAIDYGPENIAALEERAAILANVGAFDEAEKAIEKRRGLEPSVWADGVKAYILYHKGEPKGALELLNQVIEAEPNNIWDREFRARCYRMLADPKRAAEDYRWIWERRHDPLYRHNRLDIGWAGCQLGAFDEAIAIFESLRGDLRYGLFSLYTNLGMCYLARGDLEAGKAYLETAVALAVNPRQLDDFEIELKEINVDPLSWVRGDQVHEVLHGVREKVRAQRKALAEQQSRREADLAAAVETELKEVLAGHKPEGKIANWLWGAAHAALDRLYAQLKKVLAGHKPEGKIANWLWGSVHAGVARLYAQLKDVLAGRKPEGKTASWAWVGAHAGLARLYTQDNRWYEAGEIYWDLQAQSNRFPEARVGLENVVSQLRTASERQLEGQKFAEAVRTLRQALLFERQLARPDQRPLLQQQLGDALLKAGQLKEALAQYTRTLSLESVSHHRQRQADLHARIGYTRLDRGNGSKARAHFTRAIELYREDGTSDPGATLGDVCRALLRDAKQYWGLNDAWQVWGDAPETPEALRDDLADARNALRKYLDGLYQFRQTAPMLPVVTPIALEIGRELLPKEEDPEREWPLLKTHVPQMRDRIQAEVGVRVPGVRVRGNETDLPPESYIVILSEIPMAIDYVRAKMRFSPTSAETLQKLGIPKDALEVTSHPLTGAPGCWVQPDYWAVVTGHGFELWDDPLVYMVYHLEAILRRNLVDFLGVQEVENLLEGWESNERGTSLIRAALPDQPSRLRFSRLLRALVKENVPITRWEDILAAVQSVGLREDGVSAAVRDVRLRLKHDLPGNHRRAKRLQLPVEIEDEIAQWLWDRRGRRFFAIPPEEAQAFLAIPLEEAQALLSKIRMQVDAADRDLVLVTKHAHLRPLIRRLVELEFPHLMVLSQDELLSNDESPEAVPSKDQSEGVTTDA